MSPPSRKSKSHDIIAKKLAKINNKCGHAIATTLRNKQGLIEHYELFRFPLPPSIGLSTTKSTRNKRNAQQTVAIALVKVGNQLDGPLGKVHGGIIALLYDDIMSFSCIPILTPCVTRDLAVTYKVPQPHNTYVVFRVYVDEERTAAYEQEQQQLAAHQKNKVYKKRCFLRATCSSHPAAIDAAVPPTLHDDDENGTVYSTATITMVQVPTRPPFTRGNSMQSKQIISRL